MNKLIFIFLLTISSIVHAQWTFVGENTEGKYYVDLSTVQQIGQYKRAWFKVEFFLNSKMYEKMKVRSDRGLNEYDCNEKKSRRLMFQVFSQPNFNEHIFTSNKIGEWEFIPPDTVIEDGLKIVCKK